MGKNVDVCDKLRDRRYPNSKEKRFVRWKKFFSLLLKIIIIIVSARMLGAILSVENSVVIEDTVVSFIYQFIFRILVAFGVGIIIICGFLCIRCCRQSIPLFYMTNVSQEKFIRDDFIYAFDRTNIVVEIVPSMYNIEPEATYEEFVRLFNKRSCYVLDETIYECINVFSQESGKRIKGDIPRELLEKLFETMKKERPNIPVTEICIMNIPCNRYFVFNKGMEATGLEIYSFLDSIEFLAQPDWYNIFWYAIYKGEIGHEAFIGYNIIRRDDCELKKVDRWRTLGTLYKGKTADNDYFNMNGKIRIVLLSEAEYNEELEKGYADMQAGRTKNAKKAFADIRKDYSL